jgi:hypothetical protein
MTSEVNQERPWTVTYRLKKDDLRSIHRTFRKARYRRAVIYAPVLFMAAGAGLGWLTGVAAHSSRPLAVTCGAVVGGLAYLALLRKSEQRVVSEAERAGLLAEQTLTVDPKGFELKFEDGRCLFHPWRKARKVGKTVQYIVIFLDHDDLAVLVPLGAFRSEAYASLFLSMASLWHAETPAPDGNAP